MALATALLAAAAVSVPVPSTADPVVAYAAGRVLWTSRTEDGRVAVTQARLDGATPTVVTLPTPSGETWLAANATGFVVTVRRGRVDRVVRGGYDGSVQTVLECAERVENPSDLRVTEGAAGFAVSGARCPRSAVWTVAPDGTPTPVEGIPGWAVTYAEPYLAFLHDDGIGVLNLSDGSRRSVGKPYADVANVFDVLHDGSLVIGPSNLSSTRNVPAGIYIWSPGERKPQLITTSQPTGPMLAAAPGAILYEPAETIRGRAALALTGLGATGIAPVGAPGAGNFRWPLAFDGPTAAFQNYSCEGVAQVTVVNLDDRVPGAVDGCPVRLLRGNVRFDARGRGTLRVECPNGCRTLLRLRRAPGPSSGCAEGTNLCPIMAEAKLRLPARPGAQRVRVRLKRALRGRRVRAFAELAYAEFRGPELQGFPRRTLVP